MGARKRRTRNWVAGKQRDVYGRQARQAGYRSRAVYKLAQIDQRDRLFAKASRVLDLGAAPGGWSQLARERLAGGGTLVALDLLPMAPLDGVCCVQGDFTDPGVQAQLLAQISPYHYDLVISDLAPNITGIASADQARAAQLVSGVMTFAARILAPQGALVVKAFEGEEAATLRALGERLFRRSAVRKPQASRDRSREFYLVLRGPR